MKIDILINSWHNISPTSIFLGEEKFNEFTGFHILQEKVVIQELLEYAKNISNEAEIHEKIIEDSMYADKNTPTVFQSIDEVLIRKILNQVLKIPMKEKRN